MPYTAANAADVQSMLDVVGAAGVDELFVDIPEHLRFEGRLDLPAGIGESELVAEATALASRNRSLDDELSFLGYGSYDHYVPAVVGAITSRSEFATSYTPYQPEISQGTLQAIFEFQTAICELTGLDVANASLYDGATAAAESMYLCEQVLGRAHAVVLRSVNAQVRAVLRTYARAYGMTLTEVDYDLETGTTSVDAVLAALDHDTACVIVQQPNAFGAYEPAPEICAAADGAGAVGVVHCDPLSLGVLEAPGRYGAGVAVGDGQPLGNAPAYGGPSFGFMAAHARFVRRMPGRIVGETVDANGERAYALTLQTREQHIRRERATSNICTNQALNALAGVVYMSWLGTGGIEALATLLIDRREFLVDRLTRVRGVETVFRGPGFKEVALRLPIAASKAIDRCKALGVHPGYELGRDYPELGHDVLLVAVTERRTDADIERLESALREVLA